MKTQSLFYIICGFFFLAGIIGQVVSLSSKKPELIKTGKLINRFSWIVALLFYSLIVFKGANKNYNIRKEMDFWDRYKIPQIDSTMIYNSSDEDRATYLSNSKDSILHFRKTVSYDLFDIYAVTDEFTNRKAKLILTSTFIKPNILRDSSRVFTLKYLYNPRINSGVPVDKHYFDSTLKNWGLSDNLYKRLKVF